MKALRRTLDKMKPTFQPGGKLSAFHSVFEGFETFLFVPNKTARTGVHIHDAVDSKRTMTVVIMALMPALLFGMYNIGYQHYLAVGQLSQAGFWTLFAFGLLAVLPKIVVSYVVGLGIEFTIAQKKHEEIQEGFLVSGMLIPMIVPVDTPLWMIAVATAIAVVFAKEVFGGTGYNVFNVALVTRAILFFSYPSKMSGDEVFVRTGTSFGMGSGTVVDGFSGATPLGQIAVSSDTATPIAEQLHNIMNNPLDLWHQFLGLIPGSIGETSKLAILLGAILLIWTGIASWKIMLSGLAGASFMAFIFNLFGSTPAMQVSPLQHMLLGGFLFGLVFMATDPVTSARTETGKWVYGFLVGLMAVFIRVLNPGYPEGMMLAILLMNVFAPLIDYFVVDANIKMRKRRLSKCKQGVNAQ
ncbi:NADH:ubiquinone reductase (Na(+)-transporting) subunit B [Porphyromonas crevioricanis]|nr:NADH:ubiquinone reductase (Na(+)-transporting) subunit B [Porphyromonas crevioricanis]